MENLQPDDSSPAYEYCPSCNVDAAETDNFCDNCGYPLKGTETEQHFFLSERTAREIDLIDFQKAVNVASRTLYVLAIFSVAAGFISYFINQHKDAGGAKATLILNLVLALMYLCLGLWSRKKPVSALISGLSLYVIIQLLNAVVNPVSLLQGIILKIFYIGYFIKGIKSAMEAERLKKQYSL